MANRLYSVVLLLGILGYATSQESPETACSKYFEYLSDSDKNIGKITLPNITSDTIKLDVKVSMPGSLQSNFYGKLSLFEDHATTVDIIRNGQPISYRIDFPMSNMLPKIAMISVNDDVICAGNEYPSPSTALNLQNTIRTSTTTYKNVGLLP